MKKKQTPYQKRMDKFVVYTFLYSAFGAYALYAGHNDLATWILFSVLFLAALIAIACDAVYDSISERINMQSAWLDVRLGILERGTNSQSGQERWKLEGRTTGDPTEFHDFIIESNVD